MNRDRLLADIAALESLRSRWAQHASERETAALAHVLPILRTLAELDDVQRGRLMRFHAHLADTLAYRATSETRPDLHESARDHRIAAKLFSGEL